MQPTHNVLWTSGWDSTFQLVRLLMVDTARIQPIYLIDEDRPSTAIELQAMKRIKQKIREDLPARADALLPMLFCAVSDLAEDDGVADAIGTIRRQRRLGVQYDWLARFCRQFGVSDLQLCIHRDDRAHAVLEDIVEETDDPAAPRRVSERYAGSPEYELFRHYLFPVFDLTKLQMEQIAGELGIGGIMALTWFCHRPKDGKPCGTCDPCRFTIEEGLGWRVPYVRRLKGDVLRRAGRLAKAGLKMVPLQKSH